MKYLTDNEGNKYELWYNPALGEGSYTLKFIAPVVEDTRWRAEKEGSYFYVHPFTGFVTHRGEWYEQQDNERYEVGNYFKTETQATAVVDAIKALLEYVNEPYANDAIGVNYSEMLTKLVKAENAARYAVQQGGDTQPNVNDEENV